MFVMNTHEALRSPELDKLQSTVVFEAVVAIDPERNPAFTALEQIKGAKLAELFLKGYADKMATDAPDEFKDGKTTPNYLNNPQFYFLHTMQAATMMRLAYRIEDAIDISFHRLYR